MFLLYITYCNYVFLKKTRSLYYRPKPLLYNGLLLVITIGISSDGHFDNYTIVAISLGLIYYSDPPIKKIYIQRPKRGARFDTHDLCYHL